MFFFRKKLKKATPGDDEKLKEAFKENNVSSKDMFAMCLSAFLVIVLPCLLILIGICALALLLCGVL